MAARFAADTSFLTTARATNWSRCSDDQLIRIEPPPSAVSRVEMGGKARARVSRHVTTFYAMLRVEPFPDPASRVWVVHPSYWSATRIRHLDSNPVACARAVIDSLPLQSMDHAGRDRGLPR
jgi:hypothetical protein